MAALPGGAAFGTLVHAVLEDARPDRGRPRRRAARRSVGAAARPVRAGGRRRRASSPTALLPVLRTPLGPLADGRTLADIAPADRLAELDFELPLRRRRPARRGAGRARATLAAAAARAPAAPTTRSPATPTLLADPVLGDAPLRGYLTGSIDAVLRSATGRPRYLVVDYKTNRLGDRDEPLTAWHYRPDGAGRGDAARRTTRCRRCSTPSRCTGSCAGGCPATTRTRTSAACSTCSCAGCAGPATPAVDGAVRRVRLAAAGRARRRELSDLLRSRGRRDRPSSRRRRDGAARAGLLGAFNEAGVLAAADVHVAQRLGALGGETDERVLLAAALAVRGSRGTARSARPRRPSPRRSLLDEDDDSRSTGRGRRRAAVARRLARRPAPARSSPAGPDAGVGRPLRLVDGLLYLDRYWRQEQLVRRSARRARAAPCRRPSTCLRCRACSFRTPARTGQRLAAAVGAPRVSVLTGGPGTGKTTRCALLLAAR